MMAGIISASQVDWCLTSSTAESSVPVGRFSMPVMRFWIPKISVPLSTDNFSQRAQAQYTRVGPENSRITNTDEAQGMTVMAKKSRCATERIKGIF